MTPRRIVKNLRDKLAWLKYRRGKSAGHIKLGKLGEDMAVNALRCEGYRIVERNLRVYGREIDVVAVDGGALVFVEVKTRNGHSHGKPLEAVDMKRRKRLRKAAKLYTLREKLGKVPVRFDVVTVDFTNNAEGQVEMIRNAF